MKRAFRWVAAAALAVAAGGCDRGAAPYGGEEPYRSVAGGDAHFGEVAMEKYGCGSCHTIPGVPGALGTVGPPLTAFGRRGYVAGVLPNTPENLVRWIMAPQSVLPGNAMPDMGVSPGEARSIARYLYTLR